MLQAIVFLTDLSFIVYIFSFSLREILLDIFLSTNKLFQL